MRLGGVVRPILSRYSFIGVYTAAVSIIAMIKELRHDRHTVSLLTNHIVFSPKYRGKVLVSYVVMLAETIIRKTCMELDIKIINISASSDHIHHFIQYLPKYSVSFIAAANGLTMLDRIHFKKHGILTGFTGY